MPIAFDEYGQNIIVVSISENGKLRIEDLLENGEVIFVSHDTGYKYFSFTRSEYSLGNTYTEKSLNMTINTYSLNNSQTEKSLSNTRSQYSLTFN